MAVWRLFSGRPFYADLKPLGLFREGEASRTSQMPYSYVLIA